MCNVQKCLIGTYATCLPRCLFRMSYDTRTHWHRKRKYIMYFKVLTFRTILNCPIIINQSVLKIRAAQSWKEHSADTLCLHQRYVLSADTGGAPKDIPASALQLPDRCWFRGISMSAGLHRGWTFLSRPAQRRGQDWDSAVRAVQFGPHCLLSSEPTQVRIAHQVSEASNGGTQLC